MKRIILALLACLFASPAFAQAAGPTDPCNIFYYGAVPTAGQWNACFNTLQRYPGYPSLNSQGGTMSGPLGVTHIFGASGTPAIVAGAGAGTSPTLALVNAYDSDFEISLITGSSPTGSNATIGTVTFSSAYINPPNCVLSPMNAAAAALSGATMPFGASVAGGASWLLKSGSSALSASTTYTWTVLCIG